MSQKTLKSITDQPNMLTNAQIDVGKNPLFVYRYNKDAVYVANSLSNTLSLIDPNTNTVIKNINVGKYPYFVDSSAGTIYVANRDSKSISVINSTTNNVIKNITVGISPRFIGNTLFNDYLYVANTGSRYGIRN